MRMEQFPPLIDQFPSFVYSYFSSTFKRHSFSLFLMLNWPGAQFSTNHQRARWTKRGSKGAKIIISAPVLCSCGSPDVY